MLNIALHILKVSNNRVMRDLSAAVYYLQNSQLRDAAGKYRVGLVP